MSKPIVVVTEHLADAAARWLAERCEMRICANDAELPTMLRDADALVVRTNTWVTAELLAQANRLRVVGRAGVGLDNIDREACHERGIAVVHTPEANTQAVVEYVLCVLGDALRPREMLDAPVSDMKWRELRRTVVGYRQMNELTLGVLGLGRIGSRVAQIARAIGMRVLFHDIAEIPHERRHEAELVNPETLFERSDVISIHIDGRAENRSYVDDSFIRRMKPEVIFINTARGFVVDVQALASFLEDYPDAQAMIDVHEPEPFGEEYPLLGLPNAKLYPHLASRTETAVENMSWVVWDVMAVLEGKEPCFRAE